MTIHYDHTKATTNNSNDSFETGRVSFVVNSAEERHSVKAGDFSLLRLGILNEKKQSANITACLFFSEKKLWTVKAFCSSVGENEIFAKDVFNADAFVGLEGDAIVERNPEGFINVKRFMPTRAYIERKKIESKKEHASELHTFAKAQINKINAHKESDIDKYDDIPF